VTSAAAAAVAGSYLCGSIPFGLLVVRVLAHKDVREVGSGNIGATNVARAAGKSAAFATLFLDAIKGFVPALLASQFAMQLGWEYAGPACGVAAVLGHCFPVWLKFRGGKGVATGLGVALALAPWAALAGAATWVVLYKLLHVSSIGSLAGVAVALAVAATTAHRGAVFGLAALAAIILVRHKSNLERLLKRQER
jgi:glycerol-3-phosphate acyltransferase PlsY